MKQSVSLLVAVILLLVACNKNREEKSILSSVNGVHATSSASSGSGGGTTTTGALGNVGGPYRLISGNTDSMFVSFTQDVPAAGWTLKLSSNTAAVQVPPTYFVPAGSLSVHPPVTSSVISTSKNVTVTVTLNGEIKSTTFKVFPLHVAFAAPQLQSPGNGAGFKSREQIKFQWSNDVNAYYHDIQIADNTAFTNPMLEVWLNDPIWAASYFNGLGVRYWRVRYIDGSGTPGPWSAVRKFEIKS